jgi:hypothetical protein
MATDIAEIKGKLEVLDPLIQKLTAQRIDEAARLNSKELTAHLPELKHLAVIAKKENMVLKPETVEKLGSKLVNDGGGNAWDAALAFLDYRSFLNVNFSPSVANAQSAEGKCVYSGKTHIVVPSGESLAEAARSQTFSLVGMARETDAARFEELDNPTRGCGFQFMLYQMPRPGNALLLDGLYLKNVIIKDTRVVYHGGAVKLENVYFVNCTFDFP